MPAGGDHWCHVASIVAKIPLIMAIMSIALCHVWCVLILFVGFCNILGAKYVTKYLFAMFKHGI